MSNMCDTNEIVEYEFYCPVHQQSTYQTNTHTQIDSGGRKGITEGEKGETGSIKKET